MHAQAHTDIDTHTHSFPIKSIHNVSINPLLHICQSHICFTYALLLRKNSCVAYDLERAILPHFNRILLFLTVTRDSYFIVIIFYFLFIYSNFIYFFEGVVISPEKK